MQYDTIQLETSSRGVATITLNRPEKGNAINEQMRAELAACCVTLAAERSARVVIFRANGKHFCAGADVSSPRSPEGTVPKPATLGDVLEALDALPMPVVGIVHGAAAGAGAAIAAVCDVVIALDGSFFSIPEVRMGFAPGGIQAILLRAIGARQYRRYAMSGERIQVETALRIGMAHETCKMDELDTRLADIIEAFVSGAPGAQAEIKKSVAAAERGEAYAIAGSMASPEAKEGVAAFKEKRKPSWYRG